MTSQLPVADSNPRQEGRFQSRSMLKSGSCIHFVEMDTDTEPTKMPVFSVSALLFRKTLYMFDCLYGSEVTVHFKHVCNAGVSSDRAASKTTESVTERCRGIEENVHLNRGQPGPGFTRIRQHKTTVNTKCR